MKDEPAKRRLLIVEDDESVALGLQWTLEEENVAAVCVTRASEVLPAIERVRPDVILLDLNLPDADGRQVYAQIAERLDIPVIFTTGHASPLEVNALLTSPRTAFIMKPYEIPELLRTIDRLIR